MATKDEIQRWIQNAVDARSRYQRIVNDCNSKLARLEPVYRGLSDIKDSYNAAAKSTKNILREKGTWRGETYTSFCNAGDALNGSLESYYRQLDAAHDALNEEIGNLRATKRRLIPIIGDLWGQIENWRVDIENAVN